MNLALAAISPRIKYDVLAIDCEVGEGGDEVKWTGGFVSENGRYVPFSPGHRPGFI